MQAVHRFQRTPVTAIQCAAVLQAPAGGNRLVASAGDKQNTVAGQQAPCHAEKVQVEIGWRAVFQIGLAVAAFKKLPVLIGNFSAPQYLMVMPASRTLRRSWRIFLRLLCDSAARKASKSA
jgi:hypothetical protein